LAKYLKMTDAVNAYLEQVGVREHPALAKCRAETAAMGRIAGMQIAPEEGAFLAQLVRMTGARRIVEVGVFTGYSSLSMALALPPGGHIDALDVSEEFTGRARGYWHEAGVADRIALHLKPGADTLDAFLAEGRAGSYDLAFIDADKQNYAAYYARCLTLVRPGGVIAVDNVLWNGEAANPDSPSPDTQAIRALNAMIHADDRVDIAMLHIADGITLAVKR
jgi:predicted O-methyltransferase YrrM